MSKKERIDVLLVEQGFYNSRERAKRSIMAGEVLVDDQPILKPGEQVGRDQVIRVKGSDMPYVSRGGYKLEKAIKTFNIDLKDRIMLDIGASTGGFTDCALQNGAKLVYALDVGYNQLDWKIRSDERVVVMERENFRYATKEMFDQGEPDFASIDVSFISLRLILPVLHTILVDKGTVAALIKPQFEAGRERVGKNGIIRDPEVHRDVVESIIQFAIDTGYNVLQLTFSPIKGTEGNIEFLVYLEKTVDEKGTIDKTVDVKQVVREAHELD